MKNVNRTTARKTVDGAIGGGQNRIASGLHHRHHAPRDAVHHAERDDYDPLQADTERRGMIPSSPFDSHDTKQAHVRGLSEILDSHSQAARFEGKVAFITGASPRGIGGSVAERLAREGAIVALASRSEPKRLLKRLGKYAQPVVFNACDVTRPDEIRRAIDACRREFGKIDIVVNNAGVEQARSLDKFSDNQWQALLHVNLHGAIAVSQAVLAHLSEPGGVIVNVSSALALAGCSGFSVYSASKAGIVGFTQSLAWELAPRGIRVVGVAPGLVLTPMIQKHAQHLTPEVWNQIQAAHPLGMGRPADVAAAIAFLASDDARWITGVTLPLGFSPHYPLPTQQFMSE